jgi:hypothetical protein
MPSADFCTGVREPHGPLSLATETRCRPPEVSSTTFTAHPPDLQPQALDGYGLRDQLSARPTWAASYPISVRQVAALLHASFRPRLAATPLRFARTSPPSGCAGDLHPQVVEHARHTTKPLRGGEDRALFTGRRRQQLAPSSATSLIAWTAAPCYAPVWLRAAAAWPVSFPSRLSVALPRTRPLPIYSIYIKAKAVPIAASFSEIASARPTRPGVRLRSATALRIQRSAGSSLLN